LREDPISPISIPLETNVDNAHKRENATQGESDQEQKSARIAKPPPGIVALAQMNKKHRFFLVSEENYFGIHKVPFVLVDTGCNTLLLPLAAGDLAVLAKEFPANDPTPWKERFIWTVSEAQGVAHKSLTLSIEHINGKPFPVRLNKDLLDSFYPGTNHIESSVPILRFYLCTEDTRTLDTQLRSYLGDRSLQIIKDFENKHGEPVKRKRHGLLGQALLDSHSVIQHKGLLAIVDYEAFSPDTWSLMAQLKILLRDWEHLPVGFSDLEDEDHGDDEFEHYSYPLSECDIYDE